MLPRFLILVPICTSLVLAQDQSPVEPVTLPAPDQAVDQRRTGEFDPLDCLPGQGLQGPERRMAGAAGGEWLGADLADPPDLPEMIGIAREIALIDQLVEIEFVPIDCTIALVADPAVDIALARLYLAPIGGLWVLDEPFSALDADAGDVVRERNVRGYRAAVDHVVEVDPANPRSLDRLRVIGRDFPGVPRKIGRAHV